MQYLQRARHIQDVDNRSVVFVSSNPDDLRMDTAVRVSYILDRMP